MYKDVQTSGSIAVVKREHTVGSPYSLYSSDNFNSMIHSVELTGENYNEWEIEVLNALKGKRKMCFIDGSLVKHVERSMDLELWLSVNLMIVDWICTSISKAHKLWESIKTIFSIWNKVCVHKLMNKLATCLQENEAVINHYGQLAKVLEEIQMYRPPTRCT